MSFQSLLFVPGNRPERFAKAMAAGADAVCIDLEDAVPPPQKAEARQAVFGFIPPNPTGRVHVGVRFNAFASLDGLRDILALTESPARPDFLMLPKAQNAAQLIALMEILQERGTALWPVIESAEGLRNAWEIAAVPSVAGVLFGGADFSADVGCTMEWEALAFARGTLAAACARFSRQLLDVPHLDVKDADGLTASTLRAKALGFTGRACIHPDQIAAVNAAFTPTAAEIERAKRVIAALEAANGAAALLDGKLIEKPVILAAQRILDRAGEA